MSPKNPLNIDFVFPQSGGAIGLTHCPGRNSVDSAGKKWDRNLDDDLKTISNERIDLVISLLGDEELHHHGSRSISAKLEALQIEWLQFPIRDFQTPSPDVTESWRRNLPELVRRLNEGKRILIHCAAGYGRTGTMAATLLMACGFSAHDAIFAVRQARPGTIETEDQERFVREFIPPPHRAA